MIMQSVPQIMCFVFMSGLLVHYPLFIFFRVAKDISVNSLFQSKKKHLNSGIYPVSTEFSQGGTAAP